MIDGKLLAPRNEIIVELAEHFYETEKYHFKTYAACLEDAEQRLDELCQRYERLGELSALQAVYDSANGVNYILSPDFISELEFAIKQAKQRLSELVATDNKPSKSPANPPSDPKRKANT